METAIGVFTSRDHAEEAVKELRRARCTAGVHRFSDSLRERRQEPRQGIRRLRWGVCRRSRRHDRRSCRPPRCFFLAWERFLRWDSALPLCSGLRARARAPASARRQVHDADAPQPTAGEKCSEDVAFFREVLKEGRSLIVVRTESKAIAARRAPSLTGGELECRDRLPSRCKPPPGRSGSDRSLTSAEGSRSAKAMSMLREIVRDLADKGKSDRAEPG